MVAYLELKGPKKVYKLKLVDGKNYLGRSPEGEGKHLSINQHKIPDGQTLSRNHICIEITGKQATLCRIPNSSSVLINGNVLADGSDPVILKNGDKLTLGKVKFRFRHTLQKTVEDSSQTFHDPPSQLIPETIGIDINEVISLRKKCEHLEKAVVTVQQILKQDNPETALSRILEEIVRGFSLQCGLVADIDETGQLCGRAFVGLERISDLSNVSRSIIRQVLKSGKPFITSDAQDDHHFGHERAPSINRLDIHPVLCAPLRLDKNNFGVIYLDKRQIKDNAPFTQEDEHYLQTITSFVAGALTNIHQRHRAELEAVLARGQIVGRSKVMLTLAGQIGKIIRAVDRNSKVPILILGPPGAGKELIARAIRNGLTRSDKPYLSINMSGYVATPELAHSAIFGHRKGVFTGAVEDRPGAVGVADGGVIFLDEIGDIPREIQGLFKRFLAEESYGCYFRLGEHEKERYGNVVIILATNKDLEGLARDGKFEPDMVRRLFSGHVIRIPMLKDHPEDIPEIVNHYLSLFNDQYGCCVSLSTEAMKRLASAPWKYNVGELRAVVHRLVMQSNPGEPIILGQTDVERILRRPDKELENTPSGDKPLWEAEFEHCLRIWEGCRRKYNTASQKLQIAENTLRKILLEGQIKRFNGNIDKAAEFFEKTRPDLEKEIGAYHVKMDLNGVRTVNQGKDGDIVALGKRHPEFSQGVDESIDNSLGG